MRTDRLIGLRYFVCIPAGASIEEASLSLTASADDDQAATTRIRTERVADSASFVDNPSIIGRLASRDDVDWSMPDFVDNNTYTTPDLSPLMNEVIALGGWTGCGNILFVFENVSERSIVAYDGSPSDAAVLTYTLQN